MANTRNSLWLMRLASRPNIHHTGIPYIPMSLKNIEPYTRLDDYARERIKKIETIGVLKPVVPGTAMLYSTTENPEIEVKLSIELLRSEYAYPVGADGVCRGLRHAGAAVKVYGTLEIRKGEVVLVVDLISPVEDVEHCEKYLATMAKLSRSQFSLHDYDPMTNGQLRNLIDRKRNEAKLKSSTSKLCPKRVTYKRVPWKK